VTQISKGDSDKLPDLAALLPVELFKALSDPNRVAILASLTAGTQTVSQVAERCPINISVVSRHLKILKQAGALNSEKRGKEVFYEVRVPYLVGLLRELAAALETCCPDGVCKIKDVEC
jgi:ArsR family transcriptional regulator